MVALPQPGSTGYVALLSLLLLILLYHYYDEHAIKYYYNVMMYVECCDLQGVSPAGNHSQEFLVHIHM